MSSSYVSPVFVGRAEPLAALRSALERVAEGTPQAVLIGGEAGVGKTRLVEEFLAGLAGDGPAQTARAPVPPAPGTQPPATQPHGTQPHGTQPPATQPPATQPPVTALGACVEIGAEGLPFAPVSTALRSLHRKLGAELDEAVAGQEGELARLLPELGEMADARLDGDAGRARLFELTARLLEKLSAARPLVLVIEDLHWADRSTRELLAYLLRSLGTARLLVAATYRSDDIHRRHPLRPALAEFDRLRTVQRLELPRFTRDEVAGQLAGISGAAPDAARVEAVFRRSDGNAFFVEELAAGSGLSESLRDLLLVRIEALPETAQSVVRTAASGGSAVEYELLAAVCGLQEDELNEALRTAVGAGVLQPAEDGETFRFRHALMREAVGDELLPGERHRLSRRYAEVLEERPSLVRAEEFAPRLASYWYHARTPAKALPAVLRAADGSGRRHAYAEQLQLLERAIDLWDDAPEEVRGDLKGPDGPLGFLDLLVEFTTAAGLAMENERALAMARRALTLLAERPEPDPLRAAWFWVKRAANVQILARGDGWEELARAQELVRGLPPSPVHAQVLQEVATWQALHAPGAEALELAQRAVQLARLVGDQATELSMRVPLGWMLSDSGDPEAGVAEMYAVRDRALALGLVQPIGRSHANLPDSLEGMGRSAEALATAEECLDVAGRYGLIEVAALGTVNKAHALISLGRLAEAEAVLTAATRMNAKRLGEAELLRADIALLRGDTDDAERQLAAARADIAQGDPQPQGMLPLARLEITLAAQRGRILEVRHLVDEAVGEGFPMGMQRHAWTLLYEAAQAESDARGLPAAAPGRAASVSRIRAAMKGLPQFVPLWAAQALMVEAELHTAEGRTDAAAGRWAEAAAACEPLERPHLRARARYRYADALLAAGGDTRDSSRDAARELLRAAHATAVEMGAAPLATDIGHLAARARIALGDGPEPAPDTPDEAFGLTARERDVLRLVAAGRSNRQIAQELFISPKTASVHVSNILAKLGVSGRGEAAALAHRLRLTGDSVG